MKSIRALIAMLLGPFIAYGVALGFYIALPFAVHFRAWEFVDLFTYRGFHARTFRMSETGDSSREFLLQRFASINSVSVNDLGHRVSCYDPQLETAPRVLMLGDSQLTASGSDDAATLPAHLCNTFGANIYNGARRHGLQTARIEQFRFNALIFTTTERYTLWESYCKDFDAIARSFDTKILPTDLRLPIQTTAQTWSMIRAADTYLGNYLSNRVKVTLSGALTGFRAPDGHLIKYMHNHHPIETIIEREMTCARKLSDFFESKGYLVGFLYFPAHQTIYPEFAPAPVAPTTLTFIDTVSAKMNADGFRTVNTKQCLETARATTAVYQLHDTHLNSAGFGAIAQCLADSKLARFLPARR